MAEKEIKEKKTRTPRVRARKDEYVKITLVKSLIGYPKRQRIIARGLGLRKLNSSVIRKSTSEITGMTRKIIHLLKVEAADKP